MKHLGDLTEDQTVEFTFNTQQADGTPITLAGTPSLAVYKTGSTEESTAGITLTVDYDSVTGLHHVSIDTSADAFYATGNDYSVVVAAGTVDGTSVVGATLAEFSIENRFMRGTDNAALASAYTADRAAKLDEITAARMGALTDWIDGGRLDLLLDAIKAVTDVIPDSGEMTSIATAAAQTTAQNDLDIITGTDGALIDTAQTFDTLSYEDIMELLIAFISGNFTSSDSGSDKVLTFTKQDGATTKMTWTTTTGGDRTVVIS